MHAYSNKNEFKINRKIKIRMSNLIPKGELKVCFDQQKAWYSLNGPAKDMIMVFVQARLNFRTQIQN